MKTKTSTVHYSKVLDKLSKNSGSKQAHGHLFRILGICNHFLRFNKQQKETSTDFLLDTLIGNCEMENGKVRKPCDHTSITSECSCCKSSYNDVLAAQGCTSKMLEKLGMCVYLWYMNGLLKLLPFAALDFS